MNKLIEKFFKNSIIDELLYNYEDPTFAQLMLNEHFDQSTNNASRKSSVISSEIKLISRLLRKSGTESVLDIGCGPGIHIEMLNNLGFHCDGVDISQVAINEAKRRNPQSCFYCSSIENMSINKKYDAVMVLYGLLSELDNLKPSLLSLKRSMEPGGLLITELMKPEYIDRLASDSLNLSHRDSPSCFSDHPHVRVTKRFRDGSKGCLVNRSLVIDSSGELKVNESHFYTYSFEAMKNHLEKLGFIDVTLVNTNEQANNLSSDYYYISARKGEL